MDQIKRSKQWHARVADFKSSGQTMKGWCEAQGLTIHQLKYWLRKTSQSAPKDPTPLESRWLPLSVSRSADKKLESAPLVIRVGQTAIEVRAGFDVTLLRQVVRTLEAPC
jgi:hypothetical protein